MAEPSFDLDAYLARIGYGGPTDATLATLTGLQACHAQAIPFENLDVLLGRGVRLDLDSLQRKLVYDRRGGYCFEHNTLFLQALQALGFAASALAARVLWRRPEGAVTPRTHMLLRVELAQGAFIADVGFGGATPTAPLALVPEIEQATPLEPFRLVAVDAEYRLQIRQGAEWTTLYQFSLAPQHPIDLELPNWFVSTHPKSFFVHHLVAALPTADCRCGLFDRDWTRRRPDGTVAERRLADGQAMLESLERDFLIEVAPEDRAAIVRRLDQLPAAD